MDSPIDAPHNAGMATTLHDWAEEERGRRAKLAEATGLSASYITELAQGKKTPSVKTARRISAYTGLTVSQVTGDLPPGLHEGEATPFLHAAGTNELARLYDLVAPEARHPAIWDIKASAAALGLEAGDMAIVETQIGVTTLLPGEIVVANVSNDAEAYTLFGRVAPPWFLSADGQVAGEIGRNAYIGGRLVAVVRAPALRSALTRIKVLAP